MMLRLVTLGVLAMWPVLSAAQSGAVQWHRWMDQDLEKARAAGRSVYVFVGSELSELSRTTEQEVFGRAETVAWLNENFFCIKVDADREPEVAAYAQHFINSARQLKGWPVHLWLSPDLLPYDGANYLPPTEEWGRPGFLKSARGALETWKQDPARARALADEAIAQMSAPPPAASGAIDLEARLAKATDAWVAAADSKNGGFGRAPKQPEPELIRFLLKRGPEAQAVAIAAARAIVNGALHDRDEGGFHRRTIDAEWKEPYRQKLLSDQARIALALYDAAEVAKDESLRAAADGALRFVLKKMRHSGRPTDEVFVAAIDGTEKGKELRLSIAPPFATNLLVVALDRSTDAELRAEGKKLGSNLMVSSRSRPPTAADTLALAHAAQINGHREFAEQMVDDAITRYFDQRQGMFMASPTELRPGIAVRVPTLSEPIPAEALALLYGLKGEAAEAIRRSLLASIEYDELPSGAVLLALAAGN